MMTIQVMGIHGLPIIHAGDDLAALICERIVFEDGDILCIASSVLAKANGQTRNLAEIEPTERATAIAAAAGEDPRFIQVILDASVDVLLESPFILAAVPCGHIGVRAGVDRSNVGDDVAIILPPDPMAAAAGIREDIRRIAGRTVAVILTDTCGRAFRRGQTGHAVGWGGVTAIHDFRGDADLFGRPLTITEEAIVDEIAGFANIVMGESSDIDVLVEFGSGAVLFDFVGLSQYLEERPGSRVDVGPAAALRPEIRGHVARDLLFA